MLEAFNVMNDRLNDLFASKDDFASIRGSMNFEARTKTRFEKSSQQGQYNGKYQSAREISSKGEVYHTKGISAEVRFILPKESQLEAIATQPKEHGD